MHAPVNQAALIKEWKDHKAYVEEFFSANTKRANELIHQTALAGIAIIWLFRETTSGGIGIPTALVFSLVALVVTLGLDILQSLFAIHKLGNELDGLRLQEKAALARGNDWPDNPTTAPADLPDRVFSFSSGEKPSRLPWDCS